MIVPRPHGSIGETKLKILAILHRDGAAHGYGIWATLKETFHIYLEEQSRRNVYHHLHDLTRLGLIERHNSPTTAPPSNNHPYRLTGKGRALETQFRRYLALL